MMVSVNCCQPISEWDHVRIENGIHKIENGAFSGKQFTSIEIPVTVRSIGQSAFSGNSKLKEIDLPVIVYSIGASAFYNCSSLEKIRLPYLLTSIGKNAFEGCNNLKTIVYCGEKDIAAKTSLSLNENVEIIVLNGRYRSDTFAGRQVTKSDDTSICEIIDSRPLEVDNSLTLITNFVGIPVGFLRFVYYVVVAVVLYQIHKRQIMPGKKITILCSVLIGIESLISLALSIVSVWAIASSEYLKIPHLAFYALNILLIIFNYIGELLLIVMIVHVNRTNSKKRKQWTTSLLVCSIFSMLLFVGNCVILGFFSEKALTMLSLVPSESTLIAIGHTFYVVVMAGLLPLFISGFVTFGFVVIRRERAKQNEDPEVAMS